jgi:hypothetical protein
MSGLVLITVQSKFYVSPLDSACPQLRLRQRYQQGGAAVKMPANYNLSTTSCATVDRDTTSCATVDRVHDRVQQVRCMEGYTTTQMQMARQQPLEQL